jgi:hypothetical protein
MRDLRTVRVKLNGQYVPFQNLSGWFNALQGGNKNVWEMKGKEDEEWEVACAKRREEME